MEGGFHNRLSSSTSGLKTPVGSNSDTNNHPNTVAAAAAVNNSNNSNMQREQDQYVPISNIIRIMRQVLPANAKISDDAKETIQECISEFISFITGEANDRCQQECRKTVTAEDVLWAMGKLGFDDYVAPLTLYLNRYREFESGRSSVQGEPYVVRRTVDIGPPLGLPYYGSGLGMDQALIGSTSNPMGGLIGGPMVAEMGGFIGGQMGSVMDGSTGGYVGDRSGAGSSSSHPALPDFDPFAAFK